MRFCTSFAIVASLVYLVLARNVPKRDHDINLFEPAINLAPSLNVVGPRSENVLSKRTDAFPTTNDQAVTIAVTELWYTNQTTSQISALLNENNARITQIRVEDPLITTFTVSMVSNTGAYSSSWSWLIGVEGPKLGALLNGQRLISLEPYQTPSGLVFAAVTVPNTGVQDRAWWWYYDVNATSVTSLVNQNNGRLVSLRPYASGNTVLYAIIMVSNTGIDNKGWSYLFNAPISAISNLISAGMRAVTLAPNPFGGWDAVFVSSEGERWWWGYGQNSSTVTNNLKSHTSRLIDLSSYISNGVRSYATVELDDSNPAQGPINTESARVQSFAESNGWGGGFHGAYTIGAANGQSPIVAYNQDFRFEPASTIKVLYLLYTLRQGISLSDPITYFWTNNSTPDPNACPANIPETPTNARQTTIRTALTGMIQSSNNVYTRAFAIKWGTAPVEAMARLLGLSNTYLDQPYVGCGFLGAVRNELTLSDLATLYTGVINNITLSGSARETFLNTLVGGAGYGGSAFSSVVSAQAALLGKSAIVSKFLAALDVRWKGGSYAFWLANGGTTSKLDYSVAGVATIPYVYPNVGITGTPYFFGDFVNDLVIQCPPSPPCPASDAVGNLLLGVAAQALTKPIAAALATWPRSLELIEQNSLL